MRNKLIELLEEAAEKMDCPQMNEVAEEIFEEIGRELRFYYEPIDIFNALDALKKKYTEGRE